MSAGIPEVLYRLDEIEAKMDLYYSNLETQITEHNDVVLETIGNVEANLYSQAEEHQALDIINHNYTAYIVLANYFALQGQMNSLLSIQTDVQSTMNEVYGLTANMDTGIGLLYDNYELLMDIMKRINKTMLL